MNNYEITEDTLAIIPAGIDKTKIYEVDKSFELDISTKKLLDKSCRYYGSSLEGRIKGTIEMIGVRYKPPIIVEETRDLIFFPTGSTRAEESSWISLNNIINYYKSNSKTIIEFKNYQEIKFSTSFGIIDNQILRATRLESALKGRKIAKKHFKQA